MNKPIKRYCLQEIFEVDEDSKYVSWRNTNICSDDIEVLKLVCPIGKRIFDRELGKIAFEVKY